MSAVFGQSRRRAPRPQAARARRTPADRALAGGLAALLLTGLVGLLVAPSFSIDGAEVRGNLRVPAAAIFSASGLTGRSVFVADAAEAAAAIERIPDVADAHVQIRLPHHVLIAVQETEIRLYWQVGQTLLAIDETGRAIAPPAASPDPAVPTIVDQSPVPLALGAVLPDGVLEAGQAYAAHFPGLTWDGEGYSGVGGEGWQIRLGADASMLDRQLRLLDGLAAQSSRSGADIALVDLRFPLHPYARADAGAGSRR